MGFDGSFQGAGYPFLLDSSWEVIWGDRCCGALTETRFNDYVRGPLRQNLVAFLGTEDYISPKMCIVATLPIWFQSLMCVLSWYASIYQYMITNAVLQLLLLPFGLLIVYPLLLQLG